MNTDKDRIKILTAKIDILQDKLQELEDILTDELAEYDSYLPYPSFHSNNSLDILINTTALIIEWTNTKSSGINYPLLLSFILS